MDKWYGNVGYIENVETEPGIWEPVETIKTYYGEWVRYTGKFQTSPDGVNDNRDVANELSIVSDPYAFANFRSIRYIEDAGARWKVSAVQPKYPRLILTIGGVYNGQQATTAN